MSTQIRIRAEIDREFAEESVVPGFALATVRALSVNAFGGAGFVAGVVVAIVDTVFAVAAGVTGVTDAKVIVDAVLADS